MSGGQKGDEAVVVRNSLKNKCEVFDCVLLPALSELKRKRSNADVRANGRTLRPCPSSSRVQSIVSIENKSAPKRRKSTGGNKKQTYAKPVQTQENPIEYFTKSTGPTCTNIGFPTPTRSVKRSILQTEHIDPPSIFVDDSPSPRSGPSGIVGLVDGGEESEDTVLVSGEVGEDNDHYGFQMLDPIDCIMLPWTNVSTSQRSLYVPPALGNLLHHMRHSLEMERKARIRAEERLLEMTLQRDQAEKRTEKLIEQFNLDIRLLRQEKKLVNEEAFAALSAVDQKTEILPCKSLKDDSVPVDEKPGVLFTNMACFDEDANPGNELKIA